MTDGMLLAAADAVASQVASTALGAPLLPPVENLRASSAIVAGAVVRAAVADGVADPDPVTSATTASWSKLVQDAMWQPVYAGQRSLPMTTSVTSHRAGEHGPDDP